MVFVDYMYITYKNHKVEEFICNVKFQSMMLYSLTFVHTEITHIIEIRTPSF